MEKIWENFSTVLWINGRRQAFLRPSPRSAAVGDRRLGRGKRLRAALDACLVERLRPVVEHRSLVRGCEVVRDCELVRGLILGLHLGFDLDRCLFSLGLCFGLGRSRGLCLGRSGRRELFLRKAARPLRARRAA